MTPQIEFYFSHVSNGREYTESFLRPSTTDWSSILTEAQQAGYVQVRASHRKWPSYAWPGGYPLYYLTEDGGVLHPMAANKELPRTLDPDDDQFFVVAQEVNWEDQDLICDHSGQRIECAYEVDDV